jgi:beta-N-acetylhexosaminidase
VPAERALVVQVRDAHRRPEVLALLRSLADSGRRAVVVEWGWPAARDVGLARICTRGSSGPGVAAVVEVLREAGWTR